MLSYANAARPIGQQEKQMDVDFELEFNQGGVKAAIAETGAKSRDLLMVPIDKLTIVSGLNVRIHDEEYEAHIEDIKNSILANGFYQHFPLPGYAAKEGDLTLIYLTGGFTRFEAAKRAIKEGAAIEALPVVLKPPGTSMLDIMYGLDQDNTGNPFRPYERAIIVKRAINYGDSEETIATRMNISSQYVKDLAYLMSLPNALQAQVINGRAAANTVIHLARRVGPAEALKSFESGDVSEPTTTMLAPTRPARVTPKNTSGKPIVAKKTLFSAIDYAIALPGEGIKWLTLWRNGDKEAVAELVAYKPPRKNAKKPKAAAKTGKTKDVKRDPFDTGEGDEAPL